MSGRFLSAGLLLLAAYPALVSAQQGVAEPGYYPANYQGHTWSGNVAAVNETTRQITLRHESGQMFVGHLVPGYWVLGKNGKPREMLMEEVRLGTHVKVYYIPNARDFSGPRSLAFRAYKSLPPQPEFPKEAFNLIFKMRTLPNNIQRWTGIVTAVNDATREIAVTEAHGPEPKTLVGRLAEGYRFRTKDGTAIELRPSDIPLRMHVSVFYVTERYQEGDKVTELHRIYHITFLRAPRQD
jgi:hypothetical protein